MKKAILLILVIAINAHAPTSSEVVERVHEKIITKVYYKKRIINGEPKTEVHGEIDARALWLRLRTMYNELREFLELQNQRSLYAQRFYSCSRTEKIIIENKIIELFRTATAKASFFSNQYGLQPENLNYFTMAQLKRIDMLLSEYIEDCDYKSNDLNKYKIVENGICTAENYYESISFLVDPAVSFLHISYVTLSYGSFNCKMPIRSNEVAGWPFKIYTLPELVGSLKFNNKHPVFAKYSK